MNTTSSSVVLLILAGCGEGSGRSASDRDIRKVQRIVVCDREGRVRIELGADDATGTAEVRLNDTSGATRLRITTGGADKSLPVIEVCSASGGALVSIGEGNNAAYFVLNDHVGMRRVSLGFNPEGAAVAPYGGGADESRSRGVELMSGAKGSSVEVYEMEGRVRINASQRGLSEVSIEDKTGVTWRSPAK